MANIGFLFLLLQLIYVDTYWGDWEMGDDKDSCFVSGKEMKHMDIWPNENNKCLGIVCEYGSYRLVSLCDSYYGELLRKKMSTTPQPIEVTTKTTTTTTTTKPEEETTQQPVEEVTTKTTTTTTTTKPEEETTPQPVEEVTAEPTEKEPETISTTSKPKVETTSETILLITENPGGESTTEKPVVLPNIENGENATSSIPLSTSLKTTPSIIYSIVNSTSREINLAATTLTYYSTSSKLLSSTLNLPSISLDYKKTIATTSSKSVTESKMSLQKSQSIVVLTSKSQSSQIAPTPVETQKSKASTVNGTPNIVPSAVLESSIITTQLISSSYANNHSMLNTSTLSYWVLSPSLSLNLSDVTTQEVQEIKTINQNSLNSVSTLGIQATTSLDKVTKINTDFTLNSSPTLNLKTFVSTSMTVASLSSVITTEINNGENEESYTENVIKDIMEDRY